MNSPQEPSTPAPERSLNRQVVLDEDEYTAALSHIIARDFFPSLVHLDATNDYLDALHSRDPHLISASVRRLEQISTPAPSSRRRAPYQTPSQTPYGAGPSETPLRTPRGDFPPAKRARYDTESSLDTFQARYTSEDNSSFTQILDEENRQRKEKWSWAWDAQKRVEAQRSHMIEARERMLIEGPDATGVREKFMIEIPAPAGLITAGEGSGEASEETNANKEHSDGDKALVLQSKGQEEGPVDVMAPRKDTRKAGVDGWAFKTRNSLMFAPDADESPYHVKPTSILEAKGDPKTIIYGSTRLLEQDDSRSGSISAPPSPTRSRIDAAIQGTPYRPRSPTINNFSLVPNLPSPTAAELGPAAVKQLMTWGTLNATPRIISQSDDPAESLPPPSTPFHLPALSSREQLSNRLSNNAAKSLRAKAGLLGLGGPVARTPGLTRNPSARRGGSMAPPSFTPKTPRRSDAAGNLTPAARRLLDRSAMGTVAHNKRAEAMERISGWDRDGSGKNKEKDLSRARWTPTPGPVSR